MILVNHIEQLSSVPSPAPYVKKKKTNQLLESKTVLMIIHVLQGQKNIKRAKKMYPYFLIPVNSNTINIMYSSSQTMHCIDCLT